MVNVPRLVVAAPGSGHGKTTVATGLMAALSARGLAVSGHKAGPDYIDPGYHALATGRPARNLDPVLCGADTIAPLFAHGAAGADVAVVEGVMGLFDGRGATAEGSTAHVAALLGAPVVLVVDASAQGRSVAALVSGFASFDPGVRLAAVILNRVGSARHEEILRDALAGIGMPVLGALRRDDGVAAPSRHLGLVPAAEREGAARQAISRLAALVTQSVDLDAVLALARTAAPLSATPGTRRALADPEIVIMVGPEAQSHDHDRADRGCGGGASGAGGGARGAVVAVAGGAAFTFCYTETMELLTAAGADVVTVDPLRDAALPPGTGALVLGGGFPEVHASELSANERAARGRGPAGPLGRPRGGRVRRAALPGQGTGRAAHVRGARRHRADDPQPDPRLPGRGRGGLLGAHPRRDRGPWSRVPPHHRGPGEPGGPGVDVRRQKRGLRAGRRARLLPAPALGRVPGPGAASRGGGDMTAPTLIGVGMGPGDPELVTVKAVRVLCEADLVLVPVMVTGETGPWPPGGSGGSPPQASRAGRRPRCAPM